MENVLPQQQQTEAVSNSNSNLLKNVLENSILEINSKKENPESFVSLKLINQDIWEVVYYDDNTKLISTIQMTKREQTINLEEEKKIYFDIIDMNSWNLSSLNLLHSIAQSTTKLGNGATLQIDNAFFQKFRNFFTVVPNCLEREESSKQTKKITRPQVKINISYLSKYAYGKSFEKLLGFSKDSSQDNETLKKFIQMPFSKFSDGIMKTQLTNFSFMIENNQLNLNITISTFFQNVILNFSSICQNPTQFSFLNRILNNLEAMNELDSAQDSYLLYFSDLEQYEQASLLTKIISSDYPKLLEEIGKDNSYLMTLLEKIFQEKQCSKTFRDMSTLKNKLKSYASQLFRFTLNKLKIDKNSYICYKIRVLYKTLKSTLLDKNQKQFYLDKNPYFYFSPEDMKVIENLVYVFCKTKTLVELKKDFDEQKNNTQGGQTILGKILNVYFKLKAQKFKEKYPPFEISRETTAEIPSKSLAEKEEENANKMIEVPPPSEELPPQQQPPPAEGSSPTSSSSSSNSSPSSSFQSVSLSSPSQPTGVAINAQPSQSSQSTATPAASSGVFSFLPSFVKNIFQRGGGSRAEIQKMKKWMRGRKNTQRELQKRRRKKFTKNINQNYKREKIRKSLRLHRWATLKRR